MINIKIEIKNSKQKKKRKLTKPKTGSLKDQGN